MLVVADISALLALAACKRVELHGGILGEIRVPTILV